MSFLKRFFYIIAIATLLSSIGYAEDDPFKPASRKQKIKAMKCIRTLSQRWYAGMEAGHGLLHLLFRIDTLDVTMSRGIKDVLKNCRDHKRKTVLNVLTVNPAEGHRAITKVLRSRPNVVTPEVFEMISRYRFPKVSQCNGGTLKTKFGLGVVLGLGAGASVCTSTDSRHFATVLGNMQFELGFLSSVSFEKWRTMKKAPKTLTKRFGFSVGVGGYEGVYFSDQLSYYQREEKGLGLGLSGGYGIDLTSPLYAPIGNSNKQLVNDWDKLVSKIRSNK